MAQCKNRKIEAKKPLHAETGKQIPNTSETGKHLKTSLNPETEKNKCQNIAQCLDWTEGVNMKTGEQMPYIAFAPIFTLK